MEQAMVQEVNVDGTDITIRPLRSDDINIERDFVEKLSIQTKRLRFFGIINQLPENLLKKLCDIDFEHRMAFIATNTATGEELGVSRYAESPDGDGYELAVTVADEWQHKGLGTLLMNQLIDFAKQHQVKRLYAIVLGENTYMRQLAKKLGMQVKRDPDDLRQVIYSLDLENV